MKSASPSSHRTDSGYTSQELALPQDQPCYHKVGVLTQGCHKIYGSSLFLGLNDFVLPCAILLRGLSRAGMTKVSELQGPDRATQESCPTPAYLCSLTESKLPTRRPGIHDRPFTLLASEHCSLKKSRLLPGAMLILCVI